ncbi:MAG TPA: transposase [Clostridia bacterium]|nr:transposase [Clostridia bacterium]
MVRNKAYKYRIYPNAVQRVLLAKTFGSVRFVYNNMLAGKKKYYEENKTSIILTPAMFKDEFQFLKEVDSLALCNAQLNLDIAYKNFFRDKKIGFPKFKSKHKDKDSYTTNMVNFNIKIFEDTIKLPKLGFIKANIHRVIPVVATIKAVTVSKSPSGRYFAAVLFEYERIEPEQVVPNEVTTLGLDYSSPSFYVDNFGDSPTKSRYFRAMEIRLARSQRKLSKKKDGSNNRSKQKQKVAILHEKIGYQRLDFVHKGSRKIANSFDLVCVEDINLRGMAGALKLGKSTNDNGFGLFRTLLAYKLEEQGKSLIKVGKFYASSKTCSHCGQIYKGLSLSERTWTCESCGTVHERDLNAALNIKKEGLRIYLALQNEISTAGTAESKACGVLVRLPKMATSKKRRTVNQEARYFNAE